MLVTTYGPIGISYSDEHDCMQLPHQEGILMFCYDNCEIVPCIDGFNCIAALLRKIVLDAINHPSFDHFYG